MKRKKYLIVLSIASTILLTVGCQNKDPKVEENITTAETQLETLEVPIEGIETMNDQELNEKLIDAVDKMPVVEDKKE